MSSKFACCGVLWGEFIAGLSGEASWKGLLGESSTQWLPDLAKQDDEHGVNNMMLLVDLHTRYARSCEKEGRQPKYIQLGRTINDDQNPQN